MQTRKRSLLESCTNIAVGLSLSIVANFVILSYQGFKVNWHQMGWLGFWMTVLSFCRSYCLRRAFNYADAKFPVIK